MIHAEEVAREAKAVDIATDVELIHAAGGCWRWRVPSHSDEEKVYLVHMFTGDNWVCDCPDFHFRVEDDDTFACMHIKAVQLTDWKIIASANPPNLPAERPVPSFSLSAGLGSSFQTTITFTGADSEKMMGLLMDMQAQANHNRWIEVIVRSPIAQSECTDITFSRNFGVSGELKVNTQYGGHALAEMNLIDSPRKVEETDELNF
jgi:hypothetical protein